MEQHAYIAMLLMYHISKFPHRQYLIMKVTRLLFCTYCSKTQVATSSLIGYTFASGGFRDFRARTTGSHVALRARNSGGASTRELFKGSKDTPNLLVCTRKNFFGWGVQIFCE